MIQSELERDASERVSPGSLAAPSALHAFAKAVCVFAFFLLVAGGLVTSTGSSLSVPDWPLSFGKVMPPMIGGVAFEHGHRMIAGLVAVLIWSLAAWLRASEPRPWVRRLGYAAAAGVLLQAALGGATVLLRLPPPVSIAHACLAQAVFCLVVAVAASTSGSPAPRGAGETWKLGLAAVAAVYVQLILGAFLRHTGAGLWLHAAWACVVVVVVLLASTRGASFRGDPYGLLDPSTLMSLLIPAQLALGYLSYRARFSADFVSGFSRAAATTTAHLAVGALLLGTCVTWTLRAARSR